VRFISSILRSFPFNVVLYFVGFLSPPLPAAAASYDRIQTLSMDEGLPHSDVNAITQDRDGYLWFATFSGLSKYDGYRLQTFRTDNSDLTSDRILGLFVARDSSLYIGTESGGLNRYNPVSETISPVVEEPTTSADQVINNIFEDRKGTVWVCRNDGLGYLTLRGATTYLHVKNRWRGFYIQCGTALDSCRLLLSTDAGPVIYNPETEEIQNILRDEIKTRCFSMQSFADGKIALSGGWGVRIYDPKTDDLQRICDFSSRVTTQDNHGNIWVGSFNRGLYKYDRNGIKIVHYHPKLPIPHAVNSFEISALFEDRSGVLWIGTIGGGLSRLNVVEKHIECYTEAQGLCENRIITFLEARDGILWVSTHGGINLFNRSSATFRELRINGLPSIQFATVSAFFMAENGDIWLGTWDKGLWVIDSRDIDRAIQTGQVRARQLKHPVIDGELSVFRIVEDRDRHLWISSNRGCFEYIPSHGDFKTGQWINYTHNGDDPNSLCSNFTTDIYPDTVTDNKTIWIGTRSGLNRIVFDADGKANCQRIELAATNARERKVCSSDAFISTIHCDRKEGGLWIATIGEGLFLMTEGRCGGKTPRFSCFDTSNSRFFNNELESLQEDDHGAFWIGGYGITRFDPRDHSIRHFTVKDQLQSNSFKIWASYRLRNGEMVFGGVKGFNIFHPDSITDNDIRPRTAISRLKIRNQTVSAGDSVCGRVVLPRAINRLNKLDLSYNCNNLTFEFSAFAYVDPKYNTYKYRMENFDTDWNYTSGLSPQAVYTNLRPGSYRLVVYASNEDGYWSQAPAVLEITIRPPVYATRLAWLCYIALTILFLYRWHRRSLRKLQERHQIELERNKYYEEQKSSANMLQFYTDIAHELKTPLSLITAPVEELLLNPHIGKTTRNRLELVNRNAGALKTLLEQILDLRKYESHKMELAAVQTDASEFLRGIAELFKPLADQLQIQFSQEIPNDPLILWIDRRKMEIVIANLLYNAFKYSRKSSGKVNLVCEEQQLSVTISVEDNGIGIARDEQSRIFERFYQARNNNSPQKSIGIGLSLVKHIVTLHHGEIEVASELNVGSLFRVRIPKGYGHLAPGQIKDTDEVPDKPLWNLPTTIESELSLTKDDRTEPKEETDTAAGEKRHEAAATAEKSVSILVAEDNTTLRDYLLSALRNRYNVVAARNGEEAYRLAIDEQPDLLLSDIVMPEMSGIELCRKIKEDPRTTQIGVILLTAHNLQDYEISGYRVGADGYVPKPFSLEVLFSRIDNLVTRQDKIRKNILPHIKIPISEVAVEKSEDRFLVKCTETIETEIADPRFDVLQLCRKIGVSRSQLYRRILALTGLTPIQFIRSIRLKHAASFLAQDGTLPVNEVMYRVGYTNLSHFAKIFHEEFGLYPKEFALRNRSKTGKVDSASEIFSKNEPETQK
jgi:signal transduction histidine kinase/ligand-binding sensor domain-containing protein/DNA-binding response OmpR family regulator